MKKQYSPKWGSSTQTRKQRKFRANAPLHTKQKFAHSHLSKELQTRHKVKRLQLRKGDKVKILRGQFRKQTGTVDSINLKKSKIIIGGIETTKKDGSKVPYPIHTSNVVITDLKLDDKKRQKVIERKTK